MLHTLNLRKIRGNKHQQLEFQLTDTRKMTTLLSINQDWKVLPVMFEVRRIIQTKANKTTRFVLSHAKCHRIKQAKTNKRFFRAQIEQMKVAKKTSVKQSAASNSALSRHFFAMRIALGMRSQSSSHSSQLGWIKPKHSFQA